MAFGPTIWKALKSFALDWHQPPNRHRAAEHHRPHVAGLAGLCAAKRVGLFARLAATVAGDARFEDQGLSVQTVALRLGVIPRIVGNHCPALARRVTAGLV